MNKLIRYLLSSVESLFNQFIAPGHAPHVFNLTPVNPLPLAAAGSSSFYWKIAESIETDMKIILSPN